MSTNKFYTFGKKTQQNKKYRTFGTRNKKRSIPRKNLKRDGASNGSPFLIFSTAKVLFYFDSTKFLERKNLIASFTNLDLLG